jgi:hypothetical protein
MSTIAPDRLEQLVDVDVDELVRGRVLLEEEPSTFRAVGGGGDGGGGAPPAAPPPHRRGFGGDGHELPRWKLLALWAVAIVMAALAGIFVGTLRNIFERGLRAGA